MSQRPSLFVTLFAAPLLAAACGGSEAPAKQPQPQQKMAGGDAHSLCVATFQRQRECTAEFIPALVAARVQADVPAGIAAKDAEVGRDALVAKAHEEWKQDSTDAAIEATCTNMQAKMPPDAIEKLGDALEQCLSPEACSAFVECVIPVISQNLK